MKFERTIVAVMLLSAALVFSCGQDEQAEPEIIRPVRYLQAFATGGTRVRTFSGITQAGVESNLSFRVPGTVSRVAVKVGDKVTKGQAIAQLDPSDYQLQVQQAEAALANSKAQDRNARANYERIRSLYENNSSSRAELDGARATSESAAAGLKSVEKQLELAQLQVGYTTLKAPTDGAIAQVNVEANENAQAGQPIIMLTVGSDIEVKLSVPGVLISQIKEGSKVTVSCDAVPDKEFTAAVREVGVAATGVGTTFPVTVRLDSKDAEIRPGMAATVAFLFESREKREVFVIPSHAVVEDREGRFVYVVEPITDQAGFGTVGRRAVTVGELTAEGIEVTDGLIDGDLVVTAGTSRIKEGQRVKM
ncbi:efflux RND transporter periplasmic adaptor subunit [Candidatus Zixiibacteriota bacterium]